MKCVITIEMDNAAFEGSDNRRYELSRILHVLGTQAAEGILSQYSAAAVMDINGNRCGKAEIKK